MTHTLGVNNLRKDNVFQRQLLIEFFEWLMVRIITRIHEFFGSCLSLS